MLIKNLIKLLEKSKLENIFNDELFSSQDDKIQYANLAAVLKDIDTKCDISSDDTAVKNKAFYIDAANKSRSIKNQILYLKNRVNKEYGSDEIHEILADNFFNVVKDKGFPLNEMDKDNILNNLFSLPDSVFEFLADSTCNIENFKSGTIKQIITGDLDYYLNKKAYDHRQQKSLDNKNIKREIEEGPTIDKNLAGVISQLIKILAYTKPSGSGNYELLLATVFNGEKLKSNKSGRNTNTAKGDIKIGDKVYEVKGNNNGVASGAYDKLKEQLKSANTREEFAALNKLLNKEKEIYNKAVKEGNKKATEFAEKIFKSEYDYTPLKDEDAVNYFSLLSDNDKQRAILYGYYSLGYKNLILCNERNINTINNYDVHIVVINEDAIKNIINNGKHCEDHKFIIDIGKPSQSMTCHFENYKFVIKD